MNAGCRDISCTPATCAQREQETSYELILFSSLTFYQQTGTPRQEHPTLAGSTSHSAPTLRDEHQLRRPQFPPASSPTPGAKPGSHAALRRRVSAGRSRARRFSDHPRVWWPGQSRGAGRCSTGCASTGHGRSPTLRRGRNAARATCRSLHTHRPKPTAYDPPPSPPCLSSTASCHTPRALRTRAGRCTEPPVSTLARPGVATVPRTCSHCHLLSNGKKSGLSRVNTTRPECGR